MKKLIGVVLGLMLMTSVVVAEDKVFQITVPGNFTDANVTYIKEMANIGIQRILESPLMPPADKVLEAQTEIDRLRVLNGLQKKFEQVEG